MAMCQHHGYYSGPFCLDCTSGEHSAQEAGYRLFNDDRGLGQNQYASRYIEGGNGYPSLGDGLRFKGNIHDYHSIYIHVDDYDEFRRRATAYVDAASRV